MADKCCPVEVDGSTVMVHGSEAMTAEDQVFFAEIVRAAKAKHAADFLASQHRAALKSQSDFYREHPRTDDTGRDE